EEATWIASAALIIWGARLAAPGCEIRRRRFCDRHVASRKQTDKHECNEPFHPSPPCEAQTPEADGRPEQSVAALVVQSPGKKNRPSEALAQSVRDSLPST